jgi:hypothetical protein
MRQPSEGAQRHAHGIAEEQEKQDRANRADRMGRNFLTRSYPTMKKANPNIPIMIREASGTQPTVYARFGASLPRGTYESGANKLG